MSAKSPARDPREKDPGLESRLRQLLAIATPIAALAGIAVLASPSPALSASPSKAGATRPGTLVLGVTAGSKSNDARVTVRGRGLSLTSQRGARTLRLAPGRYTLVPRPYKTAQGTWYPASKRMSVQVRAGRTTRTRVAYAALVSKQARVIPAADAKRIAPLPDGSLRAPWSVARRIRAGQTLVMEPTDAAPDGLLRRVITVTKTGGDGIITTAAGTLRDIFPRADFTVRMDEDGSLTGDGVVLPSRKASNAVREWSKSFNWSLSDAASRKGGACSLNLAAGAGIGASVHAGFELDVDWGWDFDWDGGKPVVEWATFQAFAGGSVALDVNVSGSGACSVEDETAALRIGRFSFWVGPVPVWVRADMSLIAGASLSAEASAKFKYNFDTTAKAGITYRADEGTTFQSGLEGPNTSQVTEFERTGTAQATFSMGPKIFLAFYDVAGPTAALRGSLTGKMSAQSQPWWTLDAGLDFVFGGKLDIPKIITKEISRSINLKTWRIAEAPTDPAPEPVPAPDPAPEPTPVPADPPGSGDPADPGERGRLCWYGSVDLDLHIYRVMSGVTQRAFFQNRFALPTGYLTADVIGRPGCESFYETSLDSNPELRFAVCHFSGTAPAPYVFTLFRRNGTRERMAGSTQYNKDGQALAVDPGVGVPSEPPGSWC